MVDKYDTSESFDDPFGLGMIKRDELRVSTSIFTQNVIWC